jgi:hypothetical protein
MALSGGSITVNSETGAHTGSGMSFEILDAWWTAKGPDYDEDHLPQVPGESPEEWLARRISVIVAVKQGIASLLQAIADGVVAEITSNAEVTVTVTANDAGLQRLPDPPEAGAATVAPATPVDLAGTIS